MPSCTNPPGQQDRDDYRKSRFCSVECDVKYDHIAADARDAQRDEYTNADAIEEPY